MRKYILRVTGPRRRGKFKDIVNIAKTEKAKNRNTEIRISHWKLRVNGTWYRWNEIKGKIEKQNFQVGKRGYRRKWNGNSKLNGEDQDSKINRIKNGEKEGKTGKETRKMRGGRGRRRMDLLCPGRANKESKYQVYPTRNDKRKMLGE